MSDPFVQFAFSAGVLSDAFLARPDLEKFDLGLREGRNWLIDYRGGASVRPPLVYIDPVQTKDRKVRLEPFQFNTKLANTYIMVIGHEFIQFIQDGEYITEDPVLLDSATEANPAVVTTKTAHGYSPGDFIKANGLPLPIRRVPIIVDTVPSSTTFTFKTPDGAVFDGTNDTLGPENSELRRIYTVPTPYQEADLFDLVLDQFRDEVNITSTDYAPRKLRRFADADWQLVKTHFTRNRENPPVLTATASASGSFALSYGVTTINDQGQESVLDTITIATDIVNFSTTAGSVKLTWPPVAGINKYNIYRTIFTPSDDMTYAQPYGLLGEAFGPQFVDNNIIPDFTRIPPIPDNPFADGAVLSVTMTDQGTLYSRDATSVTISGGTGFTGLPIVTEGGNIIGVRILNAGEGYEGGALKFIATEKSVQANLILRTESIPGSQGSTITGIVDEIEIVDGGAGYDGSTTVSIETDTGSGFSGTVNVGDNGVIESVTIETAGEDYVDSDVLVFSSPEHTGDEATATFKTSPTGGNQPQCSARVQQRRVYGGTINLPMNVFGSVPGNEEDFSFASTGSVTDAFDLSLDSEQLTPIKYITPASIGFFVFTEKTVFQVRGTDDSLITAQTAIAEPKTQTGCGNVPPLRINDVVLFLEQGSNAVSSLEPSNLPNYFQVVDNSIYSSQFFTPTNPVVDWTYADIPDRVVWCVRADGSFLSMTYVPDQNVTAWTNHETDGFVESIASVRENNLDAVYVVVRRKRAGEWLRYIERLDLNRPRNTEQLWAVDSANTTMSLRTVTAKPEATIGNDVTFTSPDGDFSSSDEGRHIRCGNGRGLITEYVSATEIKVNIELPITELQPETDEPLTYTDATISDRNTAFPGLWHLEGRTVQIVADGGVETDQVVENSQIILQNSASFKTVGLKYTGDLVTLPLKSEAGLVLDKKKRPVDVSVRLLNSRGLQAGAIGSNRFYDFKERTFEDYGVPTSSQSGVKEIGIVSDWTEDAGLILRKSAPLRATVLGFVLNAEVGLD